MPDKNSIYTLNKKDPDAIIYTDADRHIIRLTRADFDTEADFLKWKAWSDQNYHEEEKRDHVEDNHTLPLDEKAGAENGPEVIIEQRIEKQTKDQYAAETVIRIRGKLTEKQFRRLWMRYVDNLDLGAIADQENKASSSISESINAAKKKIYTLFSKDPK